MYEPELNPYPLLKAPWLFSSYGRCSPSQLSDFRCLRQERYVLGWLHGAGISTLAFPGQAFIRSRSRLKGQLLPVDCVRDGRKLRVQSGCRRRFSGRLLFLAV
jgi:hypothetical protein